VCSSFCAFQIQQFVGEFLQKGSKEQLRHAPYILLYIYIYIHTYIYIYIYIYIYANKKYLIIKCLLISCLRFSSSWASSCRRGAWKLPYIPYIFHIYREREREKRASILLWLWLCYICILLLWLSDSAVRGRIPAEREQGSNCIFHTYVIGIYSIN